MKILFYGDTPFFPSGYGRIAQLLLPNLYKKGIEIVIQTKFGHHGNPIDLGYAIMYGAISDLSTENIPIIAKAHKIDMVIMMCDIWAFDLKQMKKELEFVPIVVYYPLDTDEIPERSKFQLERYADYVIPMSHHAEIKLRKILPGKKVLNTIYPPIPDVFKPMDVSRQDIGFKDYDIVFGMVQMNKDIIRKDQIRQLYAITKGIEKAKNLGYDRKVGIYCHMLPNGKGTGFDLQKIAKSFGIEDNVSFPIPSAYLIGFKDKQMAQIYNGIDVLMQCTSGEGFGMPTAEAMLCNTPVIGSKNSSTNELLCLSLYNYQIYCNELQYLAPAPSYIASFEHMVNTVCDVIINGVKKFSNMRENIVKVVNTKYVINQWIDTLVNISQTIEDECRVLPVLGDILVKHTNKILLVKGRRSHE